MQLASPVRGAMVFPWPGQGPSYVMRARAGTGLWQVRHISHRMKRPAKTDLSACTGRWLRTADTFSRVFS
jgi:hypothetical protein